ncbi:aminodeoxychorismate lyase [Colletotrichum higginsianum]|uniref:Aminodeoxychorismate lyase n=1 Tax=Colletotrichum higginsianum (strain IMI 349063) TaxID=759273 RepID=H1UZ13_COLHI|nr:aminodeoxychorismate lyase [Colletotrichum higginsianum]
MATLHLDSASEAILSDPNFEIITTLAYSTGLPTDPRNKDTTARPVCYLLQFGIDRLHAAATDFSWPRVLQELEQENQAQTVAKKIESHMISAFSDAASDPGRRFIPYSTAWARVGLDETTSPAECDVLLHNHEGHVTGAVFRTAYFWREGAWVTPGSESGCKLGVSRRWALENAKVKEGVVLASGIEEGELVWLSSAVGGFTQGLVTLVRPKQRS